MRRIRRFLFATLALGALVPGAATAGPDLTRTEPDVDRPLKWLVSAQNDNGGWGADVKDAAPDVATTAISDHLAHSPRPHDVGRRLRGDRPQKRHRLRRRRRREDAQGGDRDQRAGHAAAAQARPLHRHLPRRAGCCRRRCRRWPRARSAIASRRRCKSCVSKIERAQRADGSFSPDGWAGVSRDAFATGGLHAAKAAGATTSATVEQRAESHMLEQLRRRRRITSARRRRPASSSTRWPAPPRRRRAPAR